MFGDSWSQKQTEAFGGRSRAINFYFFAIKTERTQDRPKKGLKAKENTLLPLGIWGKKSPHRVRKSLERPAKPGELRR